MTTDRSDASPHPGAPPPELPAALVAERHRIARLRAEAARRGAGMRLRRRALLPAAVCSGVLAGTGLFAVWARHTAPASTVTTLPPAGVTSGTLSALQQIEQSLGADESAIAGLAHPSASTSTSPGSTAPTAPPAASGAGGAPASSSSSSSGTSGASAPAASTSGTTSAAAPAATPSSVAPASPASPAPVTTGVTVSTLAPITVPTTSPPPPPPPTTTTTAPPTNGTTGASGAG